MKNRAFLLIEIVIYIGLFSIMIGGLLVSTSLLIQNSYESDNKLITGEEINFVIKKLNWALTGAKSAIASEDNSSLIIINPSIFSEEIIFKYDEENNKIDLKTNNEGFFSITTQNVSVLNNINAPTKFVKLETSMNAPAGVLIFLNINGQSINFIKYLNYDN